MSVRPHVNELHRRSSHARRALHFWRNARLQSVRLCGHHRRRTSARIQAPRTAEGRTPRTRLDCDWLCLESAAPEIRAAVALARSTKIAGRTGSDREQLILFFGTTAKGRAGRLFVT